MRSNVGVMRGSKGRKSKSYVIKYKDRKDLMKKLKAFYKEYPFRDYTTKKIRK